MTLIPLNSRPLCVMQMFLLVAFLIKSRSIRISRSEMWTLRSKLSWTSRVWCDDQVVLLKTTCISLFNEVFIYKIFTTYKMHSYNMHYNTSYPTKMCFDARRIWEKSDLATPICAARRRHSLFAFKRGRGLRRSAKTRTRWPRPLRPERSARSFSSDWISLVWQI